MKNTASVSSLPLCFLVFFCIFFKFVSKSCLSSAAFTHIQCWRGQCVGWVSRRFSWLLLRKDGFSSAESCYFWDVCVCVCVFFINIRQHQLRKQPVMGASSDCHIAKHRGCRSDPPWLAKRTATFGFFLFFVLFTTSTRAFNPIVLL